MTSAIDRIAKSLASIETKLSACTRCGTCQAVCPLFLKTGHEADVARGKLALLEGLSANLLKNPSGVLERLERCLLCGACEDRCPAHLGVIEIFTRARCIIKDTLGLSPFERVILRLFLAVPGRFQQIFRLASPLLRWLEKDDAFTQQRTVSISFGPMAVRNRKFVPPAPKSFQEIVAHSRGPKSISTDSHRPVVVFFPGCLIDQFFPNAALATVNAVKSAGARLIWPGKMGCCGMPALSSGDLETFFRLVDYHLDCLSPLHFDYLVTACATCASTLKTLWPSFSNEYRPEIAKDVMAMAEKTMDISQFLVHVVGIHPGVPPPRFTQQTVTYHDPCHLSKTLKISEEPRKLIQSNPRYRLVEMESADSCCGFGGTFNLKHPTLSTDIGSLKREKILATGASIVASSCPACMMQLSSLLSGTNPPVSVKHVVDLYASGLPTAKFL